jgi:serine/threonine protein kinase
MAPEQIDTEFGEVGVATDVYALGGPILYELLAGRPPFCGNSVPQVLWQVMSERPAPLPQSVPSEVQRICFKCMEKYARMRYATAWELAHDLEHFLVGERTLGRRWGLFGCASFTWVTFTRQRGAAGPRSHPRGCHR